MASQKSNKTKIVFCFSAIIIIVSVIAGVLIYNNFSQSEKPFENLTAEEVKSISLYSQNVTQEIVYTFTDNECEEIVKLLNGIVIRKEDNTEYAGGFDPQFRLEKTDGTVIEFGAHANFWLDGKRYEVPENNTSLIELRKLHDEYYKEHYVPINET